MCTSIILPMRLHPVFQVKRRVEPITSLYVDVGLAAAEAVVKAEGEEAKEAEEAEAAEASAKAVAKPTVPKTAAEAAQGAIIGKRVITLKKKTVQP